MTAYPRKHNWCCYVQINKSEIADSDGHSSTLGVIGVARHVTSGNEASPHYAVTDISDDGNETRQNGNIVQVEQCDVTVNERA